MSTDTRQRARGSVGRVLRGLDGLELAEASIADLVVRITVHDAATGTEVHDVAVRRGRLEVRDLSAPDAPGRSRDPEVHLVMALDDWDDWRWGRVNLLDTLVGASSVTGHWIDLLCAHGLAQLAVVQRALRGDTPP